jgi:hypothetical protein
MDRQSLPLFKLFVVAGLAMFLSDRLVAEEPQASGGPAPVDSAETPWSAAQAASLAQWVYEPSADSLAPSLRVVRKVCDVRSGLYAELLEEKNSASGPQSGRPRLVVAIRGSELDAAVSDPATAAADLRSYFSGGKSQWEALSGPLDELVKANAYREIVLVGHSLGGMVVQLAAAHLGQHFPETPVVAWMFNSPGVDRIANSITPDYRERTFRRVVLNHVGHAADPVANSRQFGEHHPATRWQVIETPFISPHSITELSGHLLAAAANR